MKQYEIGDDVLALNFRGSPKWYKAIIVQKLGTNVYEVSVPELDVIWKRHWNQLCDIPSISDEPQINVQNNNEIIPVTPRSTRLKKNIVRYGIDDNVG
jgi:hypothetical protein